MKLRKIATLLATGAVFAHAGWDFVPEGSWADFGSARSRALGSVWWVDSAHIGLWALDQNPAGLVGSTGSPLEASYALGGTSLSGGTGELSRSEPVNFRLGSSKANNYAFQSHFSSTSETWKDSAGRPKYDLSRTRWGFDAAVALTQSRAIVFGLGMDGRFPGSQTQDTSGTAAQGGFKHVQLGVESFRMGLTLRIAQAVTLGARGEIGLDFDSLEFTSNARSGSHDPQLRWAELTLPLLGFGVAVDRADWPVSGTALFDWGRRYRIGVLKDEGAGVNRDLPQLTVDTLRFALAVQGRPDLRIPDQSIRPTFAIHWTNSSTQAYAPTEGTNYPPSHGDKLPDSSWSIRRTGLVLGLEWSWLDRINARTEGEVVLNGLTAKSALGLSPGSKNDTTPSSTDARWGLGVELSHTLVPAWRAAIPQGNGFCLRLGFAYQALGGLGLEPGWFSGLQAGREPGVAPSSDPAAFTNSPTLAQLGMDPTFGSRSKLVSWNWGLGGWTLGNSLLADLAMSWNSWTPGSRSERSGLGWTAQITYRM